MRTCFARPGIVYILSSGGPYDFACKVELCKFQKLILFLLSPGLWTLLFQGKVYVSLEVSEKPAPDCSILREKTSRLIQLRICTDCFSTVNDDKKLCCLFCEIPILTGLHLEVLLWLLANLLL